MYYREWVTCCVYYADLSTKLTTIVNIQIHLSQKPSFQTKWGKVPHTSCH